MQKATGPDEMHPRVLRELAEGVAKPLAIIFEKTWQSREVPIELRHMENEGMIGDSKHGVCKGKSCLKYLVACYDRATALPVDEGRDTDINYLNYCKAFDTVLHNILVSKLQWHGFNRWSTQWIRNCLDGHTQKSCGQWFDIQMDTSEEWHS